LERSAGVDPPLRHLRRETDDLLAQGLEDPAVQSMLDVFPAEIKEVEEM